ncbi:hypothetical protein K7X08_036887 [Anisodus acutangulus]|uniref:Uncharacterized protein n=1 Tax=Anisodus acutangulus TaxID=402998 RepID=A0A9Q1QYH9_9SOLA|nr:hypothetical protein K7X08_036887 [Anisodus acutangulus]
MVPPNFVLVPVQMVVKTLHFKRNSCLRSLKGCERLMLWIQLQKVLSMGYDDTAWPIQIKTGRNRQPAMFHQLQHTQHRRLIHLYTLLHHM